MKTEIIEKNKMVGMRMAIGEIVDSGFCDNGDFYFKTAKQGYLLIRDGVNILEPFQKGEILSCFSCSNGDFGFKTKEQRGVLIRYNASITVFIKIETSPPKTEIEKAFDDQMGSHVSQLENLTKAAL